jgi:hypothetical protein
VDPDSRRYIDPEEAPRHYIDLDRYENDTIPETWTKACEKFSEDTLKAHGIVPWHIQRMYYRLVKAFSVKDAAFILRTSAELGHYIADAHVPLHTTSNYNGQKTGQRGIHGFWESRLPELFSDKYDLFTGRASYIESIKDFSWEIVRESNAAKDSVLLFEAALNESYDASGKYVFEPRNNQEIRTYSYDYSVAYSKMLDGMVERRMRKAILAVASAWYSAWLEAGEPILDFSLTISAAPDSISFPLQQGLQVKGHED